MGIFLTLLDTRRRIRTDRSRAATKGACWPYMRVDGVHVQTLARAVLIAGSVDILALRLGVPRSTLDAWLRGEEPPPVQAFLQAVDIVVADSTRPERLL